MTEEEFIKKIKTITDIELDNRIKQSNDRSNTYRMLVNEKYRRAVTDYHNWGMHH